MAPSHKIQTSKPQVSNLPQSSRIKLSNRSLISSRTQFRPNPKDKIVLQQNPLMLGMDQETVRF